MNATVNNQASSEAIDAAVALAAEQLAAVASQEVADSGQIAPLDLADKKLSVRHVAEKLNEIIAALNKMQSGTTVARDRGPKSEKDMSEEDARRVMLGDLKDKSHKAAAETLGLSYGQVYSARKGFTFKSIYKEMTNGNKASAE